MRLERLLPPSTSAPAPLHEAMRYACLSPGKRLRPAICIGACDLCGGNVETALDSACAIEMIHCFSLIHDDLPAIDDDDLRRGLPTVHKVFGEAIAILAGDALFALAFQCIASHVDERVAVKNVQDVAAAAGTMGLVGGEVMDVLAEGANEGQEYVTEMHRRKTAALIACAASVGARLGGGSDRQVEALRQYGEQVGLAFQVTDDLLNIEATECVLGKAVGSDTIRGKSTYPTAAGASVSRSFAESRVEAALAVLSTFESGSEFLRFLALYSATRDR